MPLVVREERELVHNTYDKIAEHFQQQDSLYGQMYRNF